jgi:hypothetical protein
MIVIVDISPEEFDALKELTGLATDSDAILHAVREYVRIQRFRELKSASGNVEFGLNWRAPES